MDSSQCGTARSRRVDQPPHSATAGFSDFGGDEWREPFAVLIKAINEEAELNLFGRLMTRSDILLWLQARLGIEAAYKQHPEIDDEVIDAPLFVTGLPRSGTSILFEILAQDPQFGSVRNWEMMFPYPPPEQARPTRPIRASNAAEHLVTQWYRVTPTYRSMHEMGANIPNECILAYSCSFPDRILHRTISNTKLLPIYGAVGYDGRPTATTSAC